MPWLDWLNGTQRIQIPLNIQLPINENFSIAYVYNPTLYNNGPSNHPNVSHGAQQENASLKIYFKKNNENFYLPDFYQSGSWFTTNDDWNNNSSAYISPTGPIKVGHSNCTIQNMLLYNKT